MQRNEKKSEKHKKKDRKPKQSFFDKAPEPNPLLETIQTYFYQTMLNYALDAEDINTDNIRQKIPGLIKQTICAILDYPRSEPQVIFLPGGTMIDEENCPQLYHPLFKTLLNIKPLYQSNLAKGVPQHLDAQLTKLAAGIAQLPNFKNMLCQLCDFILESKGLEPLPIAERQNLGTEKEITTTEKDIPLITLDIKGVDLTFVRRAFYKKMFAQTILAEEKNWIPYEDLESEEPYIYLALPALALIDVLHQSQAYTGICLLSKKMLVPENCPQEDNFPELFQPIFQLKSLLKNLSEGELKLVSWKAMQKPADIPVELLPYDNPKVTRLASVFNDVATEISKRKLFQELVPEVIENCIVALNLQREFDSRLKLKMG